MSILSPFARPRSPSLDEAQSVEDTKGNGRAQLLRRGRVYNAGVMIEEFMSGVICGRRDREQPKLGLPDAFNHAKNGTTVRLTHRFASTMQMKIAPKR